MAGKKLNAIITIGGAVSGTLRGAISSTKGGLDSIGKSITDLTNRQRELNRAMNDWRPGNDAANLRLDLMRRESAGIGDQIAQLKKRQAIEEKITALREKQGVYAANIAKGVAAFAAVGAAATVAFQANADFEGGLLQIGLTANMTDAQIVQLGKTIKRVARETGNSSNDTRDAIGFMVAAGMDIGTATRMLETAGRTATATKAPIEDVSKAIFTLNDSLKIDPEKMKAALDSMVVSGKAGNVEFRDMAKQLPVLGSGFVALKMEGAEAVATMGAALQIARKGAGNADEAANNMKNFIAKVMAPDTLKKAKKNFGIDLYKIITDAQSKGKNPFEAAMAAIMKATEGDQKKISELFGDMEAQNFVRPMIQNWQEYQKIKNEALAGSGAIDTDFGRVMVNSSQKLKNLTDRWTDFKVAIGGAIDGPGAGFLGFMTTALEKMTAFTNENPRAVAAIGGTVGALAGATIVINAAAFAWGALKLAALRTVAVMMTMRLGAVVTGLWTLAGTILTTVIPAVISLGTALLTTPVGWFIGAVALIAGGAYLIYRNWDGIKSFFTGMWSDVKGVFESSINWLISKLTWAGEQWRGIKATFGFGGDEAAPAVGGALPKRAYGGPVRAGRPYVVGERRPELFVPNADGRIVPHLPQAGAGAAPAMVASNDNRNFVFNITAAPGQSPKAIADEVERRLRSSGRSAALHDHAMGY